MRSDRNLRHGGGERRCDRLVDHRAKQPDGQYGVKGDAMSDFNTVASVDPPETILDLELHDTAYEVLLVADRVIPRSLMDFLR